MELHPSLQIRTLLKSMSEVILPAVDPVNKPAVEEARQVIAMLQLLLQRAPLQYRYDRDELARFLELSAALQNHARGIPAVAAQVQALTDTAAAGADVLERACIEPADLQAASGALRERIGGLLSAIYAQDDWSNLGNITACVNTHAQGQMLRERAWLAPQGWEGDAAGLPDIAALI